MTAATRAHARPMAAPIVVGLAFGALGALVTAAPMSFGDVAAPAPWLAFLPVFFWAVARPGVAPAVGAFGLGLLQDLLTGGPPGVWAFGFLAGYAAAAFQRDTVQGQPPAMGWVVFAVCVGAAAVSAALAGWLALGRAPALGAMIAQAVATVLVAPLAAQALGGFRRLGLAAGARG